MRRFRFLKQPVLLQLVLQRTPADSQGFGGLFAIAGDMRERLANQQLLDFRERSAWTHVECGRFAVVFTQRLGQMWNIDNGFAASNDQALNGVAKLADISGPGKPLAQLQCLWRHSFAPPFMFGGEILKKTLD